jgi:hypothetical protein
MKLFNVYIGYGIAVVVAKDKIGVLMLISNNPDLRCSFEDLNGNLLPSKEILQSVEEIPGYSVQGETEAIISWYRE